MSGASLCNLLAELGFEDYEQLDPDSFEWPFQYEEAQPILHWLCSNLRRSNVLSPPEVAQYEELLAEGKLLEGEDLDFAYESISAFSSRRTNQEAVLGTEESLTEIREATAAYRAEALELQKRLRRLQNQFDLLSGQASALIQGRRARVAATSSTNGQLLFVDEKLASRNMEINAVMDKIASSAQELAHYHSGEEEGIYLSYADFHPYTMQDLACTKELNQWFVKQFDVGPSRLVAEEGKSKCSWVSLDDVTNCFIRGDSEKSYHHRVVELQRLRSIFGISERQWVEAQVEYAKQQAILAKAKLQVSADEAHVHLDLQSLRRRNAEIAGELSTLSQEEEKLLYQVIPKICMDLAELQDTYILQGDYDLKVMRQEYYISQQKRFITHLVNQLARHQFLQIACQLERKTMNGAYELLRAIESELEGFVQATSGRVERCLSLIEAGSEPHEQGAVDDRDTLLHRIRDLLSIHTNNQGAAPMYVSAPGIVQQIGSLQSDLMSLQLDLENSLAEDKNKCINELCTIIRRMQRLLFASSTTAQPILTPWPLMRELSEMEKVNSQLSTAIEEVTREHREKAEIVRHHPHEVGRERQVFVDFFCNPDRLRNHVRELTARINSRQTV
uniref:AUGMIN subunit3 n=1 Tax=Callitropsis funebris TaxID=74301 RepID=A0A3Q8BVV1_9CONI|nr:AUGMIN subunit3 [Callitropsis funebris]